MRRLERIEKIKAKERQKFLNGRNNFELTKNFQEAKKGEAEERMKAGKALDPVVNCPQGKTRDIVAQKSGFGSRDTYGKAKFIAENADYATWHKLTIRRTLRNGDRHRGGKFSTT
ncbi:hypothetical protein BpJC7_26150 [Weizmannia acidilactici]|uniref:Uncharacterized protein n=1 Tax=Weizmannia acidilactici TaxID=2607726 RepID=A0A5J4J8V3_9BACI|nr:hypothetical protein [Weizmannia acidilactici]GER71312.1 hypothetical protein BpJC7_26150 [Weizmannia acidilactici]